jgi:hypothetical protein
MAFRVFENADQGATFVVTLITLPVCILATVLRFAVIIQSNRKVAVEDWFTIGALLPYLAWSIYGLVRTWISIFVDAYKPSTNLCMFMPRSCRRCGEWNKVYLRRVPI